MKKHPRMLGLALVAMLGTGVAFLPSASSGEKKSDGGKKLVGESKPKERASAATINFAKELGLSFAGLTSLGARIEQARNQADPVGLANAARELNVAEKVSEKKAALTAEALIKEAVELAKNRYDPAELKAVALLAGKHGKELKELAPKAQKAQDDARKAKESGETTRGIQQTVHVDSRVNAYIRVYVNGVYRGTMGPWGDIYPWVGDQPWQVTVLYATSDDGRFWSRTVSGNYSTFHWILYP